ncbi:PREDICTED: transcription factor bHLH109-like [Camelina sativa]|uniref:Transcription factor bHLH109-like n=1 Tax=Camelina sativa TaxID=90675 RepID=A0ABM0WGH4_CAMSA|nr:PREDICTED: transcription factor bHLH109-like [Camelina sativa]
MEGNNRKDEGTYEEEEVCSFPKIVNAVCSNDRTRREQNPLQQKLGAHPSSMPNDVTMNSDHGEKVDENLPDEESNRTAKLQRHVLNHRMVKERKRRQSFKEKVEILQSMMPMPPKSDTAGKLDNVIDYLQSLQYQIDLMNTAYAAGANSGYMLPYYGAQPPSMSPWGYYPPPIPMMPQQVMRNIPQIGQGNNNVAQPARTKPPPGQTKPSPDQAKP